MELYNNKRDYILLAELLIQDHGPGSRKNRSKKHNIQRFILLSSENKIPNRHRYNKSFTIQENVQRKEIYWLIKIRENYTPYNRDGHTSFYFCVVKAHMKKENKFQAELIKELKAEYPDAIVTKLDANHIQGIPDLLILEGNKWAALECKRSAKENFQPNQPYYVEKMNNMSFASVIYPENKKEVLDALQSALRPSRSTRVSKRKQVSLD